LTNDERNKADRAIVVDPDTKERSTPKEFVARDRERFQEQRERARTMAREERARTRAREERNRDDRGR
jgi:hypothetical protein